MNRPANSSNCEVCDGSEYYVDAGFYYCQECHTQSKDARETAFEETFNPTLSRSIRIKNRPKTSADTERGDTVKWTSWQGYNFVLTGLVDELIAIGAKPELKIIVLQLWSKYLSKLEAAFTSTTDPELPKFGLNQCEKDFDIIYGTKKVRKKMLVKKKKYKSVPSLDPNTSSLQKSKAVNKMRKAVLKEDYELIREEIRLTQDVMSQVDDRLKELSQGVSTETTDALPPTNVLYSKEAMRIAMIRQKKRASQGVDVHCDDEDFLGVDTDSKSIDYMNPHRLTRIKLISLLVLALNLSKEEMQISDIIRWISEGHLSYQKVTHLFPDHVQFSQGDSIFLQTSVAQPTYKSLLQTVAGIACLLGVNSFPTPDLLSLARRYVGQLQLPDQLMVYVERLMASSKSGVGDESQKYLNYEGLAMAYVIMAVKLLFGLDGETEHRISEVAEAVNCLPDYDNVKSTQNLFVWDEWVCYVECRKAVVLHEHFPTKHRLGASVATSIGPYVDYLQAFEEKDPNVDSRIMCRHALGKVTGPLTKKMKWSVNQLPEYESTETPCLVFPPTLTPLTSYLNVIMNDCQNSDNIPVNILSKDHTKKTIAFLLEPNEIVAFARDKGLNIDVQHSRAIKVTNFVPVFTGRRQESFGSRGNRKVQVYFVDEKDTTPDPRLPADVTPWADCKRKRRVYAPRLRSKGQRVDIFGIHKIPAPKPSIHRKQPLATQLLLKHVYKRLPGISHLLTTPSADEESEWTSSQDRCPFSSKRSYKTKKNSSLLTTPCADEESESTSSQDRCPFSSKRPYKTKKNSSPLKATLVSQTLYLPYNNYWLFECEGLHRGYYNEFEKDVQIKFPNSFLWLLTECSRLLEMKTKDLYLHLTSVEEMYFSKKIPMTLTITR